MRLLYLLILLACSAPAFAQTYYDSTASAKKMVFVRLKDGTTLRGRVLSTQDNQLRLRTDNFGELTLDMANVAEISEAEGYMRNGQFWFRNPFYTSYFASPTALTLRKGEAQFQNSYIFINTVSLGITDHFTLGGGGILLPGFGSTTLLLTPKVCLNRNRATKFGIGTLSAVTFVRDTRYTSTGSRQDYTDTQLSGLLYGSVTFGHEERNGTISAGWAYGNGDITRTPIFSGSYFVRFARKAAFITENWLIPSDNDFVGGILSAGVRLFGDRIGGDLGLWVPVGAGNDSFFFAVPYAGLKVKFGKPKNAVD